jgi:hypothetical protein
MTPTVNQVAADLLLDELDALGVTVNVAGGNLHVQPQDRLTPRHVAKLRELKPELIRAIRLASLTEDERVTWHERVAICVVDGGLTEAEAEAIAWRQVEGERSAVA